MFRLIGMFQPTGDNGVFNSISVANGTVNYSLTGKTADALVATLTSPANAPKLAGMGIVIRDVAANGDKPAFKSVSGCCVELTDCSVEDDPADDQGRVFGRIRPNSAQAKIKIVAAPVATVEL